MPEQHPETVLIVDFGAQYAQLIARRVRQFHVYSEIVPYATPLEEIRARRPKGIILSGGPASVYDEGAPRVDPGIYELGVPVLGICYGMQLMSIQLGGDVRRSERREYGRAVLHVDRPVGLFEGLPGEMDVWMSHGDSVLEPPPGFEVLAHTERTSTAAIAHLDGRLFGVQFHPEVVHTPLGGLLIESFLTRVCRCRCDWTPESFIERSVREIRQQVGDGHVLAALSGGVDSSVAAALVAQAVGDRLTCVFIDHGFMRAGEPEQVAATFGNRQGLHFVAVDASQRFLARLEGVTDPEVKRRRIGEEFIRVFEAEARKIGQVDFLVQGTLYPDVVESGTATAATIKTHHNVGGLPADMRFQLIEPFRELFKDEVRAVGEALGLPEEIVWRHPFPGPGLAIRIIGEVTPERLRIERTADRIVTEEIDRAGLHRAVWQVFAVLLPMRSVGVMGDGRTYGYTCAVRAVTSEDGMTADWARLPHEVLERIANRIVGEVAEINRVVYDITSKPPGTIEWE